MPSRVRAARSCSRLCQRASGPAATGVIKVKQRRCRSRSVSVVGAVGIMPTDSSTNPPSGVAAIGAWHSNSVFSASVIRAIRSRTRSSVDRSGSS
ncbi:hypothetical protein EDD35_5087 [Amycolatopsis thermoflava]|uniref:Uncharacterized protein n=1 Tax=Amycolatopsis thermoflava TaxID=84480 RepID=A0A3N2H193_9PSEU|nr:hypothetical protein EDD35_5087 [Amycolatopsis thermoflava]